MRHRKGRRRYSVVLLVALFLLATACGGAPKVAASLGSLRTSADEAAALMIKPADPAEFTSLSTRMDELLQDVPAGTLTSSEQATVDLAAQRAAALREVLSMFGASDEVLNTISSDAVELVTGSMHLQTSPQFREHLVVTSQRLLRDTTCSMFADAMSEASAARIPEAASPPFNEPPPTQLTVWEALQAAIAAANYDLSNINQAVDLSGLSAGILTKAKGYVSRIENTMTAASWQNGGAFQVYMRHCVR